jgi:hypothetical protein
MENRFRAPFCTAFLQRPHAYAAGSVIYESGVVPDGMAETALEDDPDMWLLREWRPRRFCGGQHANMGRLFLGAGRFDRVRSHFGGGAFCSALVSG